MATENQPPAQATVQRFGIFEMDLRSCELRKRGMRMRLQQQPFQVLALLIERRGELVTREELQQKLWPADTFVDFEHGLNTAINKLRDVLGDSANAPRYVETLPRRGYRFIYPLQAGAQPESGEAQGNEVRAAEVASDPEPANTATLHTLAPAHARMLFVLAQALYFAFYIPALAHMRMLPGIVNALVGSGGEKISALILLTATLGTALRLYFISAVGCGFGHVRQHFLRIFPAIFLLDVLWALSPFLLWQHIGYGLAFACMAALLWLPFAQRTLARAGYPAQ